MKIYALICHKLDLTQFWPKVVSWRFEITTDELTVGRKSAYTVLLNKASWSVPFTDLTLTLELDSEGLAVDLTRWKGVTDGESSRGAYQLLTQE